MDGSFQSFSVVLCGVLFILYSGMKRLCDLELPLKHFNLISEPCRSIIFCTFLSDRFIVIVVVALTVDFLSQLFSVWMLWNFYSNVNQVRSTPLLQNISVPFITTLKFQSEYAAHWFGVSSACKLLVNNSV